MAGEWNHSIQWHEWIQATMPYDCAAVLDIGCGDGQLVRRLARHAESATGIEPDPTSINEARALSTGQENVAFIEGDFLTHPFNGTQFDYVTAVASLHHMSLEAALARAQQLLRPGGVLAIVGCARSAGPVDVAYDIVGVVANKIHIRRRGWWEHHAPKTDPHDTYADVRRTTDAVLAGNHYRRRALFRYTVTWQKPR